MRFLCNSRASCLTCGCIDGCKQSHIGRTLSQWQCCHWISAERLVSSLNIIANKCRIWQDSDSIAVHQDLDWGQSADFCCSVNYCVMIGEVSFVLHCPIKTFDTLSWQSVIGRASSLKRTCSSISSGFSRVRFDTCPGPSRENSPISEFYSLCVMYVIIGWLHFLD